MHDNEASFVASFYSLALHKPYSCSRHVFRLFAFIDFMLPYDDECHQWYYDESVAFYSTSALKALQVHWTLQSLKYNDILNVHKAKHSMTLRPPPPPLPLRRSTEQ